MTSTAILRALLFIAMPASLLAAPSDSGWVRVVADPEGSQVFIGGRFVGSSPVDSIRWAAGQIVVQAEQGPRFRWNGIAVAESVTVPVESLVEVRLSVPRPTLRAELPPPGETPEVMRGPGSLGVKSETWTIVSGAAMVASGVLAAVFRDKANQAASRFLETQDPAALDEVRRYDRYAGAAMVGVQIGLGTFVLFLAGP